MGLISTGDIRTWMAIEEGDKKPNAKLDAISKSIEQFVDSYTNRKMMAATYFNDIDYSYLDGNGLRYIYLPLYPVSYVSEVNIDSARDFGSGTALNPSDYFLYSSSGKVVSEAGKFSSGRRNVKIGYTAGYAPIVGGTHDSAVSTYPLPYDLRQVMIEMSVESFKEGITAVHTAETNQGDEVRPSFIQMLTNNSFWRTTLNKYKAFDMSLHGRDE